MTHELFNESIILAGILFALGFVGVLVRRDLIFILMSIEIMLNAAALLFITAGMRWDSPDGQVFFLFILATAAAEVAIGLALVLRIQHDLKTLDVDAASRLRG